MGRGGGGGGGGGVVVVVVVVCVWGGGWGAKGPVSYITVEKTIDFTERVRSMYPFR